MNFSYEVGGVDVGCFGEPGESAGGKDEFYRYCGSD
jgi:hypothetical protein